MELTFEQTQFPCLRRVAHLSVAQEQTQELIIPDAMADASRTLICYAEPELQSKTSRDGSLLITGLLRASCLYADEQGDIQPLSAQLPFTAKLEHPQWQEQTLSCVSCTIRSADARLINSRKLLLRVNVLVQADGYEPTSEAGSTLQDAPGCLQQKTAVYSSLVPVELSERAFSLSEELVLPEGRSAASQLISCAVNPVLQEQNLVGDKALAKGKLELLLTYLDAQNIVRTLSLSVPFSQYCQLQQTYSHEETLQTSLCLTGVQAELIGTADGQKLLLGVGLVMQCLILAAQHLCVCEDAYATRGTFTPQWQTEEHLMRLDGQTIRASLRESLPVEGVSAVLDCRIYQQEQTQQRTEDGLVIHAPLRVDVLYADADGALQMHSTRVELTCRTALCETGSCEASLVLLPECSATAGTGAIELRCEGVFSLQCFCKQTLKNLVGGSIDPHETQREPRASVIIRRTAHQQALWELAKQYRTTTEAIQTANGLSQPEVDAGQLLLIPM